MICNKCNHRLPEDSQFCQYCGIPIVTYDHLPDTQGGKGDYGASEPFASSIIPEATNENVAQEPQRIQTAEILTEKHPIENVKQEQTPQPTGVVDPINSNIKTKKKVRYCSRCGSLINSETKQCTGCGKKYFKGIRFNKIFFIVLSFSLALLAAIGFIIYQYNEINVLNEESSSMQSEISGLNSRISSLNSTISSLNSQISTLKTQKSNLEKKVDDLEWEKTKQGWDLDFYEEYAAIVTDASKKYHVYGCDDLDTSSFRIHNTKQAENLGYYACSKCH